jgi:hypothetical protein
VFLVHPQNGFNSLILTGALVAAGSLQPAELTQQKEVEKRCKDEPHSPSQFYSKPTRVYPDIS